MMHWCNLPEGGQDRGAAWPAPVGQIEALLFRISVSKCYFCMKKD